MKKRLNYYLIVIIVAAVLPFFLYTHFYDKEYLDERDVFNERMAKFLRSPDETVSVSSLVTHEYEYVCKNYDYEYGIYGARQFIPIVPKGKSWRFRRYNDIYFDENQDGLVYISIGQGTLNSYRVNGTKGDLMLITTRSNKGIMCASFQDALLVKRVHTKNYIYIPSNAKEESK